MFYLSIYLSIYVFICLFITLTTERKCTDSSGQYVLAISYCGHSSRKDANDWHTLGTG